MNSCEPLIPVSYVAAVILFQFLVLLLFIPKPDGLKKLKLMCSFPWDKISPSNACKLVIVLGLSSYSISIISLGISSELHAPAITPDSPTNLSHLVFGLLVSVKTWHHRKAYIESWWRPNVTRGLVYFDEAPTGDILPWSAAFPPYRVSDNVDRFLEEKKPRKVMMMRTVHAIMEVMREMEKEVDDLRWVVMGDDDTIFFVENMVDVVGELDHKKFYYVGGQSEYILSNHWFSFDQAFGGAGFMLSYPLARALANDMENCLRRYANLPLMFSDTITMLCIADLGVNLSPHKGIHQIDLRGDISGFLSSHPKSPLLSLHHLDAVKPILPDMDSLQSTRHLMKAAAADQSRILQQTICHHRRANWSISISWGYSAHIYESILPRSHLQKPLETFRRWTSTPHPRPFYMFDTRLPYNGSCTDPHLFFFKDLSAAHSSGLILTTYSRAAPRRLRPCSNNTADFVFDIRVLSPKTKRKQMDRCECCDVIEVDETSVEVKFRECMINEVIV